MSVSESSGASFRGEGERLDVLAKTEERAEVVATVTNVHDAIPRLPSTVSLHVGLELIT